MSYYGNPISRENAMSMGSTYSQDPRNNRGNYIHPYGLRPAPKPNTQYPSSSYTRGGIRKSYRNKSRKMMRGGRRKMRRTKRRRN